MPKQTQILKSVGKTINLAKPQVYQVPRKPPLNSLVFEKLPEPRCGDRIAFTKPPAPKPVRVCTKEELQAMYCYPPPCDCPEKTRMTTAQKIGYLITLAAKILFLSELIKFTWREGLWSDAFHSSCILQKLAELCPTQEEPKANEFEDQTKVVLPEEEPCMPYIPRSDVMLYKFMLYWNKVVTTIFWFIFDSAFDFWEFLVESFKKKPVCKVVEPCEEFRAKRP